MYYNKQAKQLIKAKRILKGYDWFMIKEIPITDVYGRVLTFTERYEKIPFIFENEVVNGFLGRLDNYF